MIKRTNAIFIPPFNDSRIIAGQATAAKELLEEHPDLDFIVTPVGGGGLSAGCANSLVGNCGPPAGTCRSSLNSRLEVELDLALEITAQVL